MLEKEKLKQIVEEVKKRIIDNKKVTEPKIRTFDITKFKVGKIYKIKDTLLYYSRNKIKTLERVFKVKVRKCPICNKPCLMKRYRKPKFSFERGTNEVSKIQFFDATECAHKIIISPHEYEIMSDPNYVCHYTRGRLVHGLSFRIPNKVVIRMK